MIFRRVSEITCPGIKGDFRGERDQTSSHSVHRIVAIFHKTLHRLVSFYCISQKKYYENFILMKKKTIQQIDQLFKTKTNLIKNKIVKKCSNQNFNLCSCQYFVGKKLSRQPPLTHSSADCSQSPVAQPLGHSWATNSGKLHEQPNKNCWPSVETKLQFKTLQKANCICEE